ncbi:MAG: hypothetical protein LBI68_01120 [Azoarcus sp.]|jgi:hypothetical protein|nr:hypothetical protein [Azoarcus sp.]
MEKIFRSVADFWLHFSLAERHQIVGAACFLIVVFYGLLFWYPADKMLGDLAYKEQKQVARNRAVSKNADVVKNFNIDGLDIQATRRELAAAQESFAALEAEQARLSVRFTPLDDAETLQALKSELTRLAESGDMEIDALEHIYSRRDDKYTSPTPELLKSASEGNRYKRPLLNLRARASYWGLMAFLDGLPTLSRIAAPVWSNISVKVGKTGREGEDVLGIGAAPKQWLEVEIHLAI